MAISKVEICLAAECLQTRGLPCCHSHVFLHSDDAYDVAPPKLRIVRTLWTAPKAPRSDCDDLASTAVSDSASCSWADMDDTASSKCVSECNEAPSKAGSWADLADTVEPAASKPSSRKSMRLAQCLAALSDFDHRCVIRFSRCGRLGMAGAELLRNYLQLHFGKVAQVMSVNPVEAGCKPKMMFVVMASEEAAEKVLQAGSAHEVIAGVEVSARAFEERQ